MQSTTSQSARTPIKASLDPRIRTPRRSVLKMDSTKTPITAKAIWLTANPMVRVEVFTGVTLSLLRIPFSL